MRRLFAAPIIAACLVASLAAPAGGQEAGAWWRAQQAAPAQEARKVPRFMLRKKKLDQPPRRTRFARTMRQASAVPIASKRMASAWLEPGESKPSRVAAAFDQVEAQEPIKPKLVHTISLPPLGGALPFTGAYVARQAKPPARPEFIETADGAALVLAAFFLPIVFAGLLPEFQTLFSTAQRSLRCLMTSRLRFAAMARRSFRIF